MQIFNLTADVHASFSITIGIDELPPAFVEVISQTHEKIHSKNNFNVFCKTNICL
jgi:hypothetical protein